MKADVLTRLESQQTSIGKKVLTFVPYDNVVNAAQVLGRMKVTGLAPSLGVVQGCLNSLSHVGLLREPDRGFFIRISAKDAPKPVQLPIKTLSNPDFVQRVASEAQARVDLQVAPRTEPAQVQEKGEDLMTRFGAITADMRLNAKDLIDMAEELDEFILSLSGQLDKLNQLKKIMKGFE